MASVGAPAPTFSQIHEQYKPGMLGRGSGEHLRATGTRLYTHSAFAISGSGPAALAARQAKWEAGAAHVKQAIDREFGPGMGERAFAKVSRESGHNLSAELRRGDLVHPQPTPCARGAWLSSAGDASAHLRPRAEW